MRGATTPRRRAGLLLALAAAGASAAGASCAARATPAAPAVARPAALAPPPASTASIATAAAGPTAADPPWLTDIETELGALRGLPFKRRVPFGSQTRAAFRDDVRTQLLRDLPATKSTKLSRAYAAFGFVQPGFDLSRAMEDALATQVAAYYDPKTRAFKIVEAQTGSPDKKGRSTVVAHELTHALQDQYFDLASFCDDDEKGGLDDDQRVARRFVSEGEATFLMMAHDLGSGPPAERRLGPLAVAGLRMNITMSAAADMLELLAALRQGSSAASLDPETRTELAALEKLPPLVTMPLLEPYLKGALFVSEVWAKGGWPAVDALYRLPPESTEQVLHPADKFFPAREPPVHIRLRADGPPAATGATLLTSEVVGELGWRIYFKTWGLRAGDQAAAGWEAIASGRGPSAIARWSRSRPAGTRTPTRASSSTPTRRRSRPASRGVRPPQTARPGCGSSGRTARCSRSNDVAATSTWSRAP